MDWQSKFVASKFHLYPRSSPLLTKLIEHAYVYALKSFIYMAGLQGTTQQQLDAQTKSYFAKIFLAFQETSENHSRKYSFFVSTCV